MPDDPTESLAVFFFFFQDVSPMPLIQIERQNHQFKSFYTVKEKMGKGDHLQGNYLATQTLAKQALCLFVFQTLLARMPEAHDHQGELKSYSLSQKSVAFYFSSLRGLQILARLRVHSLSVDCRIRRSGQKKIPCRRLQGERFLLKHKTKLSKQ